jgi:hypothetical protein
VEEGDVRCQQRRQVGRLESPHIVLELAQIAAWQKYQRLFQLSQMRRRAHYRRAHHPLHEGRTIQITVL